MTTGAVCVVSDKNGKQMQQVKKGFNKNHVNRREEVQPAGNKMPTRVLHEPFFILIPVTHLENYYIILSVYSVTSHLPTLCCMICIPTAN